MRILVATVLAGCFMLASSAMACPYMDKQAAAKKAGCAGKDKVAKAGGCVGCKTFHASYRGLRATGANVEVVKTKRGYIVLATAESPKAVASVRKVNTAHLKVLASMGNGNGNGNGNGKDGCKFCTTFSNALKSGAIHYEEVTLSNGVMTVYTASSDEGQALLKRRCGSSCRLKAAGN